MTRRVPHAPEWLKRGLSTLAEGIDRLREYERPFVLGVTVLGIVAVSIHWLSFVIAGALLGLGAATFRRALAYGLGFGVMGTALFLASLLPGGLLGPFTGMGQLALASVAVALALPTLAAIAVRGIY